MKHLEDAGIPSMIYYPIPLYKQEAYRHYVSENFTRDTTEALCKKLCLCLFIQR